MATLYQRNSVWWLNSRCGEERVRRSTGTADKEKALAVLSAVKERERAAAANDGALYVPASARNIHKYLLKTRRSACERDILRGRKPELSLSSLEELEKRASGQCEITGIPFSLEYAPGSNRRPFAPSIDRIDRKKPYSLTNCRLICLALNVAVNSWGIEAFRRMALAFFCPDVTQNRTHIGKK